MAPRGAAAVLPRSRRRFRALAIWPLAVPPRRRRDPAAAFELSRSGPSRCRRGAAAIPSPRSSSHDLAPRGTFDLKRFDFADDRTRSGSTGTIRVVAACHDTGLSTCHPRRRRESQDHATSMPTPQNSSKTVRSRPQVHAVLVGRARARRAGARAPAHVGDGRAGHSQPVSRAARAFRRNIRPAATPTEYPRGTPRRGRDMFSDDPRGTPRRGRDISSGPAATRPRHIHAAPRGGAATHPRTIHAAPGAATPRNA